MEYLLTFYHKSKPNVGKYSIDGVYIYIGIVLDVL